jgi:hypothetical protein
MIGAGLRPTDPVRWWMAYAIERDEAGDDDSNTTAAAPGTHDPRTL